MKTDVPVNHYEQAVKLDKRDCFQELLDYLSGDSLRVCILYGLRRTGKTTLLYQAIEQVGMENAGFVLCEEGDDFSDVSRQLKVFGEQGKKFVFIDEITKLPNFVNASSVLADYYTGTGMKIVVSGTDSLGMLLACRSELYDRATRVHTTYISFGEYMRLIKKADVDDFIHYAGVLSHEAKEEDRVFFTRATASHYIDTAISNNITNSFFRSDLPRSFRHTYDRLVELHRINMLVPVINLIVEQYSGTISESELNSMLSESDFVSADLHSAIQILEQHDIFLKSEDLAEEGNVDEMIAYLLSIRTGTTIDAETVEQIKDYLMELDVLVETPLVIFNTKKGTYNYAKDEFVVQQGMKYCQTKAISDLVLNDSSLNLSPKMRSLLQSKIETDAKGQILENTVICDLSRFLDKERYDIFKIKFVGEQNGEIDVVVYDKRENAYYAFEVKHSQVAEERQKKHLQNEKYRQILDGNFGHGRIFAVLYRGKTMDGGEIKYINVSDFLNTLYKNNNLSFDKIIGLCVTHEKEKGSTEYTAHAINAPREENVLELMEVVPEVETPKEATSTEELFEQSKIDEQRNPSIGVEEISPKEDAKEVIEDGKKGPNIEED